MPSAQLSKIPSAAEFVTRIRGISDDLIEIARDLAAALDVKPQLAEELAAQGVARGVIRRLERLGRGQIHQSLVFSTTPGGLRIIKVPLSEQTLALTNGIEILDSDEHTIRNIPVHELTCKQAAQAIAGEHIRTTAEQRTWIREQKERVAPTERDVDFRVGKDFVVTLKPGKWSRHLLISWLSEMK